MCFGLEGGVIDYGVLQWRNSTTGSVTRSSTLVLRQMWIVGPNIPCGCILMGLPNGFERSRGFSHPQGSPRAAFSQKTPRLAQIPYLTNRGSAQAGCRVQGPFQRPPTAAGGPAALYGLEISLRFETTAGQQIRLFIVVGGGRCLSARLTR
jgi:hypothetical protein